MISTKLTLSANKLVIADAKRLAAARHDSVSSLFGRFIAGVKQYERPHSEVLTPLTRQASGMIRLPAHASDKALTADALAEKYDQ